MLSINVIINKCVYSFNSEFNACFDTLMLILMFIVHADGYGNADGNG